jgi:hypothetical protein
MQGTQGSLLTVAAFSANLSEQFASVKTMAGNIRRTLS